jgi:hypothetical protein
MNSALSSEVVTPSVAADSNQISTKHGGKLKINFSVLMRKPKERIKRRKIISCQGKENTCTVS